MSSRGRRVVGQQVRAAHDRPVPRRWRAPRARRGAGSRRRPRPRGSRRGARRRCPRGSTTSTARPVARAALGGVEHEEPGRRGDGRRRPRASERPAPGAPRAPGRRFDAAGSPARRGPCRRFRRLPPPPRRAVIAVARRHCRASSHDWRIAHAAASSMRARAFLPRTSLAASARWAWTVVSRSSQSSTVAARSRRPPAGRGARASRAEAPRRRACRGAAPRRSAARSRRSASSSSAASERLAGRRRSRRAARVGQQAELVVDGHADARLARVERANVVPSEPPPLDYRPRHVRRPSADGGPLRSRQRA